MQNFLELVAKERARQINDEGYKREHDDEHTDGSLADAAACYAANSEKIWQELKFFHKQFDYGKGGFDVKGKAVPLWKWHESYFKKDKHPRKKQLIISAALLMAEYDRLEREEQKQPQGDTNEIPQH